jgi:hypothetical protein
VVGSKRISLYQNEGPPGYVYESKWWQDFASDTMSLLTDAMSAASDGVGAASAGRGADVIDDGRLSIDD